MNLKEIRDALNQKKGQANQIQTDLNNAIAGCKSIEKEIAFSEKSQAIIQAVAKSTQEKLQYRIEEPVSLALASVYDNPYKLSAKFDITGRGTTEVHLAFERDGYTVKPVDNYGGTTGGGPVAIASLALRIGSWSLAQPRSRPILIIDEPFGHIDKAKIGNSDRTTMHLAGAFLKQISKPPPVGLGLQIILISHIKELIEAADQIIETKIKGGISTIEVR